MTYIVGSPEDFLAVRHLTLRGSQVEIGRALAGEVRSRSNWAPTPISPLAGRARRTWFERNWPQHQARTLGMAEVFGIDPSRDDVSFDGLSGLRVGSGCSAVWRDGRLARNYDFFTLSEEQLRQVLRGLPPAPSEEPPMSSRPYVITTIPDDGLASTVLTMSALDGAMEGINECGLAFALLIADGEAITPIDAGPQAGLDVSRVGRFLLDTCENAEQAKEALLGAKQYDGGVPVHYIIADASGNAFVWERGAHDTEHIIEVSDGPLCVTNHPLHKYPDVDNLPQDNELTFHSYERLRTLSKEAAAGVPIRDAVDAVAVTASQEDPWCTIWRSVFDLEERTMTTRFFLGGTRYSDEVVFRVR